jgi:hypothetical protein
MALRAEVAEWQTLRSQTPLRATSCGFESHLRYHQDSHRDTAGIASRHRPGHLTSSAADPANPTRARGRHRPLAPHAETPDRLGGYRARVTNEKRPLKEDLMREVRARAIPIGLLTGVIIAGLVVGLLSDWKY